MVNRRKHKPDRLLKQHGVRHAIVVSGSTRIVEHAAMLLEWIRRRDGRFDKELKDYLFTDAPITTLEGKHHE